MEYFSNCSGVLIWTVERTCNSDIDGNINFSIFLLLIAPPSKQPHWRYPNSPEPKKARKFNVSLNHTPFESRTSQKAPFAPRATMGGSTTLRGKDFSPATYNSLSDPHLNPYFSRKFGKSASLRELGLSKTKVLYMYMHILFSYRLFPLMHSWLRIWCTKNRKDAPFLATVRPT